MVTETEFRNVMGQFAAGVTVVTLPGDPPHGITVNAFASVSLSPPLVLVCLDHETTAHERLAASEAGEASYCVNVLAHDQRHLGEHFANIDVLEPSPFESERTDAAVTGAPVFRDSLAYLDCTVHEAVEAGDHTIYLGAVEQAEVLRPDADALTFHRGDWGTVRADG